MKNKYRRPVDKSEIWVHFDKYKKNGKVWAVQYYSKTQKKWLYKSTKFVYLLCNSSTRYFKDDQQPKAVINCWNCKVIINKDFININYK